MPCRTNTRLRSVNWKLRTTLALAAGVGVYASRGSLIGLDAGVALLIATFVLKLVELRTRRDALVLVFLGFAVGFAANSLPSYSALQATQPPAQAAPSIGFGDAL